MKSKTSAVIAMIIFGSVGIFVRNINLSSLETAFLRAGIGSLFLMLVGVVLKIKISFKNIKANLPLLILSGISMGINWTALFQGYKYTTVSNAILGYYFAPIFVVMLSPIVLKEKITLTKIICICVAMAGLFLIIKAGGNNDGNTYNHVLGIAYSIFGAILYAAVILLNKHIKNLPEFETTLLQLMIAAITLLPAVLLQSDIGLLNASMKSWGNVLILGVIHTGIAFSLYFRSIKQLEAQSIAILSYIDPASAVIMAILFLGETITIMKIVGGILILGSTYLAESVSANVSIQRNN